MKWLGKKEGDWKAWFREKKYERWFRRDNLIVLVLSGILVFIIAMPMDSGKKGGSGETASPGAAGSGGASQEPSGIGSLWEGREEGTDSEDGEEAAFAEGVSDENYAAYLEERLTDALGQVAGVGKVRVMITLSASSELVVQRENPVTRSATNETDSQGGNRVVNQVETQDAVVYRSQGTDSEPYVIKTLPPRIEGVLVVAEGAGSGTVNRTVTAIVQALFDVEAHKVSVVKMEQGQREEKNVE